MPENSDYKDYFFGNVPRKEFSDVPKEINNPELYKGLNPDQAFQLLVAIVAAEEGAHVIADELKRVLRSEISLPTQVVEVEGVPTPISAPIQRIWISKKYDADTSVNKTITGGRQMLEIAGPGRVVETILIASVNTIGMQVMVDGDIMYSGDYTALAELTRADSRLSVYKDEISDRYVIRVADIGFKDQFVFIPTCTGTVTFDIIRCNYNLYAII